MKSDSAVNDQEGVTRNIADLTDKIAEIKCVSACILRPSS